MKNVKWLLGLFAALSVVVAVPVFAAEGSTFGLLLMEDGLTENRDVGSVGLLKADIPLISTWAGKRVATLHFDVIEQLGAEGNSPFGFVADLVYDFGHGATINAVGFLLWCNLINVEDPEPEFEGGFVVLVCTGEGEITGGTGVFANVSGKLTRHLQLFEGTAAHQSDSDKGYSLFEIDRHRRHRR